MKVNGARFGKRLYIRFVATSLLRSIFTDLRLHDLPQNEYTSVYQPLERIDGMSRKFQNCSPEVRHTRRDARLSFLMRNFPVPAFRDPRSVLPSDPQVTFRRHQGTTPRAFEVSRYEPEYTADS
jgi:hypothetical protein